MQRAFTRIHSDTVSHATISSELYLKHCDCRTRRKGTFLDDGLYGSVNLLTNCRVLALQIEKWDGTVGSTQCSGLHLANHASWITRHNGTRVNVTGHHAPSPNDRPFPNCYPAENNSPRANRGPLSDTRRNDLPVVFSLHTPILDCGPWIAIIDKHHVMSYEDIVLNSHPLTDERMTRYLTVASYPCTLLNFDKGANLGIVT